MATETSPTPPVAELAPFPVRRFSVAEYHQLGELGVLTPDDRVELLEGWIIPKMNHNPRHDVALTLTEQAIRDRISSTWVLRIQCPITTPESEPEPDIAVVLGPARRYTSQHPRPEEIGLVVEIADTSLARDWFKKRVYAQAGIAVYWLVNLIDGSLEVYTEPARRGKKADYRNRRDYRPGETLPLLLASERLGEVAVADLLP